MSQVKPMRADARRNYERLLKAAAEAFGEYGEQASLDDIAKRAGVGSGTLYRHFPTRQALLEAAYLDRIEAFAVRAEQLGETLPPGEALVEWLNELCLGTLQMRGIKALLGVAATDGQETSVTKCSTRMRCAADQLVTSAQTAGHLRPDVSAVDILSLAHGVATAAALSPEVDDTLMRRYVHLLTEGLRAR